VVAGLVACVTCLLGIGALMTRAQPASRTHPAVHEAVGRHSGDDGGFSVTLTEPTDPYLVGVKRIAIEPHLPPGDAVAGADFFVDGRLVSTDRKAPFGTEIDFGQEIKRHTIIVTVLTAGGRRAKVSFVSRAADLQGEAAEPLALVPAVVRDARGRFVDGLSVGDFVLTENGARQAIVHFDDDPVPQSIVVTIQADAPEEARHALVHGARVLSGVLPSFDALGFLTLGAMVSGEPAARPAVSHPDTKRKTTPEPAEMTPPPPAAGFSFDRAVFAEHMTGLDGAADARTGARLEDALLIATRGLQARPRGRVLLLLMSGSGPREAVTGMLPGPQPAPEATAADRDETDQAAQDLSAALDAVKRSGATLHVVVYGGAEDPPFPQMKRAVEESGGEFLVAASAAAVDAACRRIAESMVHQYLVSFSPASPDHEGWRTIELRLSRPGFTVQSRKTYFASALPKRP
jgi:hypothetical protein